MRSPVLQVLPMEAEGSSGDLAFAEAGVRKVGDGLWVPFTPELL